MSGDRSIGDNGDELDVLRAFLRRIEHQNEIRRRAVDELKRLYREGRDEGFDPRIVRRVVWFRSLTKAEKLREQASLDLFLGIAGDAK